MKVTRDMLHDDVKANYLPMKIMASMFSKVWGLKMMNRLDATTKGRCIEGVHCEERTIPSRSGGPDIRIRVFRPINSAKILPGMLYLHGGGYTMNSPESYLTVYQKLIASTPCVIVAPAYRRAMEAPYPAAFDDCYDTLLWLRDHADELGVVPDRFIVGGHSAGGGLTAAVVLKATDTGEAKIAFQMPICPMIDDRNNSESAADSDAPVWNTNTNRLGWELYLHDLKAQNMGIPAYAAPARATDYSRLPPTISFVGDLEPFRDETIAYIEHLRQAGIPVAFQVFEGCYHGFEIANPQAGISQAAWTFMLSSFQDFVGRYFQQDSI